MHLKTLISFSLAMVLASCVSTTNLEQTAIVFNPVIGNEVRSENMSVPFPEDKTFGVWAMENDKSTEYICDQEIGYAEGLWTSGSLPLWPASSSLTFYAYSPYDLPVSFKDGVMMLDDFDVTCDGDEFLFAWTASELTAMHGNVKLPFQHALSRIDMRIASGYGDGVQVRVDRIILKNVSVAGDFNSARHPYWTVDESTAADVVIFDSVRDGEFLAGTRMQFVGKLQTVIPQKSGSFIELHYSFRMDGGDWITGQKDATGKISVGWEPGRYYTYSLTINEVNLSYTTGIGLWSERE